MRPFLEKTFGQIREYFGRMSKKDKIRLTILSLVVVALAIVAVVLLGRTNYVTLYAAQSTAEAGEIFEALRDMGEPAKVEGTRVLVAEDRASELRARLAAQGVIDSDDTDLTIMESAASFNVTDSHAKKLYEAQAESQIRAQILKVDKIQSALVTVNFGEYSPFVVSQGVRDATASVMLVVRGGAMLTNAEAQSIAAIVMGSIQGIKYENIAITDSNLNHYRVGDENADLGMEMNSRIALQNLLQQQIKMQGEQLLTPVFGMDNLQVSAHVTLNFDKELSEQVEFFPPIPGEMDGIVRSKSELFENQRRAAAAGGIPGTDTNAMGTVDYPYGTLGDDDEYRRAVLENNYEINETRTVIERQQGNIEEVSVAVLIDSESILEDYSAEVTNLVAKGLGIAAENIAVEHVPFSYRGISLEDIQAEREALEEQARRRELLETILMWAVILLLGLAFMSLIKAIVKAIRGSEVAEHALVGGGIDYLADDYDEEEEGEYYDSATQYEDVKLNTKSSGLEQIERFIDSDASAVAQLLRNWLSDE